MQHTIPLQCTDNIAVGCFVYILEPANEIGFAAIQRLCRHICLALADADIQGAVNDKEVVTSAVLQHLCIIGLACQAVVHQVLVVPQHAIGTYHPAVVKAADYDLLAQAADIDPIVRLVVGVNRLVVKRLFVCPLQMHESCCSHRPYCTCGIDLPAERSIAKALDASYLPLTVGLVQHAKARVTAGEHASVGQRLDLPEPLVGTEREHTRTIHDEQSSVMAAEHRAVYLAQAPHLPHTALDELERFACIRPDIQSLVGAVIVTRCGTLQHTQDGITGAEVRLLVAEILACGSQLHIIDTLIKPDPEVVATVECHGEDCIVLQPFFARYVAADLAVGSHHGYALQHSTQGYLVATHGKRIELVLTDESICLGAVGRDTRAVVLVQSAQVGTDQQTLFIQRLDATHLVAAEYIRAVNTVHARAGEQIQTIIRADIDSTAYLFGAEHAAGGR